LDGEREKCIAAGMDDYIAKPVSDHELRGAVERWTRAPEAEVIDAEALARLLAINRDDATFFEGLVALFREDAPQRIAAMRDALAAGSSNDLARAAHALKS